MSWGEIGRQIRMAYRTNIVLSMVSEAWWEVLFFFGWIIFSPLLLTLIALAYYLVDFTVMFPSQPVNIVLLDGPFPPSLLMLSCHFALIVLYSFPMICCLIRHRCAPDLDYTSHHCFLCHHFLRLCLSCFLFDSLFISFGLHFSSYLNNNIANFTHHTLFCSPFA